MRRAASSPRGFSRTDLYVGVCCRETWDCAVGSATDVGALSSHHHGSGCTRNVPGCRAFGLPLGLCVAPKRIVAAAGAGALGAGAGGAVALGAGGAPAALPGGAGGCPEWCERTGALSDVCRLPLPGCFRWGPLRRQLRIFRFHVSNMEPSGSRVANSGFSKEKTFLKGNGHQRRL